MTIKKRITLRKAVVILTWTLFVACLTSYFLVGWWLAQWFAISGILIDLVFNVLKIGRLNTEEKSPS